MTYRSPAPSSRPRASFPVQVAFDVVRSQAEAGIAFPLLLWHTVVHAAGESVPDRVNDLEGEAKVVELSEFVTITSLAPPEAPADKSTEVDSPLHISTARL